MSNDNVLTVAGLNREARRLLETGLGRVMVEGELSNVARPASGHMYWTLKDGEAQIRCAMFRQANRSLTFVPENGLQVLVRGRVSLYEPRGDYQLIVESMDESGEGALRRQFDALKRRLEKEGLFAPESKTALPAMPATIGLITSPTGAAIRDVLIALQRRFPGVRVVIYPTSVQGAEAASEIVRALQLADRRQECDVVILTRGGGSLEDLWPFNEEIVARAIAKLSLPTISGVGHETDFTIADFVADLRAPTPSQAAELAVPDQAAIMARLKQLARQLATRARHALAEATTELSHLNHRLNRTHPRVAIQTRQQRIDDYEYRNRRAILRHISETRGRLAALNDRLRRAHPARQLATQSATVVQLKRDLSTAITRRLEKTRNRVELSARALQTLSPLATLERGYAIVSVADGGPVLTQSTDAPSGTEIDIKLSDGDLRARVTD